MRVCVSCVAVRRVGVVSVQVCTLWGGVCTLWGEVGRG